MTEKNSGPEEGIKGAVEDVKGKAKEAVGTVTGRDDVVREGKAQQDKADAQKDAAKKEAEAEAARGSVCQNCREAARGEPVKPSSHQGVPAGKPAGILCFLAPD